MVKTGIGKTKLVIGGEVDAGKCCSHIILGLLLYHRPFPFRRSRKKTKAESRTGRVNLLTEISLVWDSKPQSSTTRPHPKSSSSTATNGIINWVELKTTADIPPPPTSYHQSDFHTYNKSITKYHRKLLKFWIQSFLLGVPKLVIGFRSEDGILKRIEELETKDLPKIVSNAAAAGGGGGKPLWNGNTCINFTAEFLECMWKPPFLYLPKTPLTTKILPENFAPSHPHLSLTSLRY